MARKGTGGTQSPDSGYSWRCQYCEGDVVQIPPPELIFHLETVKGQSTSTGYQACMECANEIRESNEKFNKKTKLPIKQTVPLRDLGMLAEVLPDGALDSVKQTAATDAKLDKLTDAVAALTQLMTLQMQSTYTPPVNPIAKLPAKVAAPIPKPKRKILRVPPMVKASAKSKVADKPRQIRQAKAKQKPRSKK